MLEAYICDFIRTPFGRYGGQLSTVRTDDLAAIPIRELMRRCPKVEMPAIDNVILGCANQAGEDNRNVARMAGLLAGLPDSVAGMTVNRLCVSLLNKAHGMFNRHGLKVKKEALTSRVGFARNIACHDWSALEQVELEVISAQLDSIKTGCKQLEKEITRFAKTLDGYDNLISIKGIGSLSAAVFMCTIGDIKDFAKPGKLAAYFGITPRVSQSNDSQRVGRITKRYSPYLQEFYERIKSTRGAGKAIIATARKLLNTIYYTLKNKWVFENFPKFEIKT